MLKVLHYKSNFLNYSETFIKRLIDHHRKFEPAAMCINRRELSGNFRIYAAPKNSLKGLKNTLCFHLNQMLPFYKNTISKEKPDIIHAHFGYDGYRMIKPSKRSGIPLVVSFYGSDVSRLPSEFDWKRRYRKLAVHANQFIAISNLMKGELIKLGFPKEKINVIRFGINLNEFSFKPSYQSELPLMMVGRMVEKKGFIYALKAIKILKDQGLSIRLDIYGNGILRNELEKQAKQWNITSLITFKNHRTIEKICKAYQTHSVLLVPSITASDGDQEGIPNTLLEGMASGIPIIAANHSGIPEVVIHQKTGLLIPEKDAGALAEMIKIIKEKKIDVSILCRNARQKVEQEYELNRMVENVENIYQKAISKT